MIMTALSGMGVNGEHLSCDTVMSTPLSMVMFKGGTNVVLNRDGKVVEGVLATDTDRWTTGPLVLFAGSTRVMLNNDGKVYEGFPAVNFIAEATNGVFYEFKAMAVTFFDNEGRVSVGAASHGIEYMCRDGAALYSEPGTEIAFYPSGVLRKATPAEAVKLSINRNEKIFFMAHKSVFFDRDGYVTQGVSAKKATFLSTDGTTVIKHPGDILKFSSNGILIE